MTIESFRACIGVAKDTGDIQSCTVNDITKKSDRLSELNEEDLVAVGRFDSGELDSVARLRTHYSDLPSEGNAQFLDTGEGFVVYDPNTLEPGTFIPKDQPLRDFLPYQTIQALADWLGVPGAIVQSIFDVGGTFNNMQEERDRLDKLEAAGSATPAVREKNLSFTIARDGSVYSHDPQTGDTTFVGLYPNLADLPPDMQFITDGTTGDLLGLTPQGEITNLGKTSWAQIDPSVDFVEGTRRFDENLAENSRQFNVSEERLRSQFQQTFAESARQFNVGFSQQERLQLGNLGINLGQLNLAQQKQVTELLRNPADALARLNLQRGGTSPVPVVTTADLINQLRGEFNRTRDFVSEQEAAVQLKPPPRLTPSAADTGAVETPPPNGACIPGSTGSVNGKTWTCNSVGSMIFDLVEVESTDPDSTDDVVPTPDDDGDDGGGGTSGTSFEDLVEEMRKRGYHYDPDTGMFVTSPVGPLNGGSEGSVSLVDESAQPEDRLPAYMGPGGQLTEEQFRAQQWVTPAINPDRPRIPTDTSYADQWRQPSAVINSTAAATATPPAPAINSLDEAALRDIFGTAGFAKGGVVRDTQILVGELAPQSTETVFNPTGAPLTIIPTPGRKPSKNTRGFQEGTFDIEGALLGEGGGGGANQPISKDDPIIDDGSNPIVTTPSPPASVPPVPLQPSSPQGSFGRLSQGVDTTPVTQAGLLRQSALATTPGPTAVLRGQRAPRLDVTRGSDVSLFTPQQFAELTPDEVENLRSALAIRNLSLEDFIFAMRQRFQGRGNVQGRLQPLG